MTRGSRVKLALTVILILLMSASAAYAIRRWAVEYDGGVLPGDTHPKWTVSGLGDQANVLVVDTIGKGSAEMQYMRPRPTKRTRLAKAAVDTASSIEARVKMGRTGNEGTIPDTALIVYDSSEVFKLVFMNDRIAGIGPGQDGLSWPNLSNYYAMDTTSAFHTYRMDVVNGTAAVYVDGIQRLTLAASLRRGTRPTYASGTCAAGRTA